MTYDPRNDPHQPISWSNDPVQQGKDERGYGNGYQLPQLPDESTADYQRRIAGVY